jgi:hypothetical protein
MAQPSVTKYCKHTALYRQAGVASVVRFETEAIHFGVRWQSRFGVLQQMDVKRKDPTFGMGVTRNIKAAQGKKEGGGTKDRPRTALVSDEPLSIFTRLFL